MSTKHTPGPWFVDQYGRIYGSLPPVRDRHGSEIVEHPAICIPHKFWDAVLIAAAPDLLDALHAMLENWEHGGIQPYPIAQARAAIAKATEVK
jgi:hypothetical protein